MQTKSRLGTSSTERNQPQGEGMNAMSQEIEFRMRRLQGEAERERLVVRGDGVRQHVGHALMALGHAIHGLEPEHHGRTALGPR